MFGEFICRDHWELARQIVSRIDLSNPRYEYHASPEMQMAGVLAEMTMAYRLGLPIPDFSGRRSDAGYDFEIGTHRVDLKTALRGVDPLPHYFGNLPCEQAENNSADMYVFASYNSNRFLLTICGFASKLDMLWNERFHAKGEPMENGKQYTRNTYAIRYEELRQVNDWRDLVEGITSLL